MRKRSLLVAWKHESEKKALEGIKINEREDLWLDLIKIQMHYGSPITIRDRRFSFLFSSFLFFDENDLILERKSPWWITQTHILVNVLRKWTWDPQGSETNRKTINFSSFDALFDVIHSMNLLFHFRWEKRKVYLMRK